MSAHIQADKCCCHYD